MLPCLSLLTSQNRRRSFYAFANACTLSLSSQIASRCCSPPPQTHRHLLISFLDYTVFMTTMPKVEISWAMRNTFGRELCNRSITMTITTNFIMWRSLRKENYHNNTSCIVHWNGIWEQTIFETPVRLFSLYFEIVYFLIYFLRTTIDSNAIAIWGSRNRLIDGLIDR